jgi:Protein of unknown function (DUF2510)
MYEFDSISVSSYEASSLASKLTERSGDGWDVVAIVPTGSEITAYLRRSGSASSDTATTGESARYAASSTSSWDRSDSREAAKASTPSEPAGWGTAPESTPSSTAASWGATGATAQQATPSTPATAQTTPSVPAGWYADPAGRYELRYWDGSAWTEHVSRAGQQYTDPPVA